MTSQPMETLGQWKVTVWEEENFQGKRCEFLIECPNIMERGFRKIRSIKVENGPEFLDIDPNVFFFHPGGLGLNTLNSRGSSSSLRRAIYPRFEAWSGNSGYRTEHLLSFRPVKCANHSDSKVTLYEGENFQGRKFELCDDYPSLQAMGWCSKEVASIKVSSGGWVGYQFPGYRGYQYVLERDRHNGRTQVLICIFLRQVDFCLQSHQEVLLEAKKKVKLTERMTGRRGGDGAENNVIRSSPMRSSSVPQTIVEVRGYAESCERAWCSTHKSTLFNNVAAYAERSSGDEFAIDFCALHRQSTR
ncbi:unnamed protein product [Ranitomeya imitator]|uniref:Beta-crystallin A2 n=1 Tax=Ranitomeya imitator TaxID=111125 RepID=A0ABN9L3L8_9NEOB|nr:unnamed protein product [Ranitomeya imitator]